MDYLDIINSIKSEIKNTHTITTEYINHSLIMMYFRIGKIINDNSKYGNSFINKISSEIILEYPKINGFSPRNLKYMKRFYCDYENVDEKVQQAVAQLPWGHNIILMEKIKDIDTRKIYIDAIIENGWSRNTLIRQIETNYHKRIGNSINNFKKTLPGEESKIANTSLKDPYVFNFVSLNECYRSKI